MQYEFNESDLDTSQQILRMFLEEQDEVRSSLLVAHAREEKTNKRQGAPCFCDVGCQTFATQTPTRCNVADRTNVVGDCERTETTKESKRQRLSFGLQRWRCAEPSTSQKHDAPCFFSDKRENISTKRRHHPQQAHNHTHERSSCRQSKPRSSRSSETGIGS